MGIPIPTVYMCQEQDETYSVIDGQQRITSFVKYLENEYALVGLSELPELNGRYFKELDKSVQKKLKSSSLRAIIILKESQELKYEIFARLNQGSVSLRPQELRNCIYRGSFNEMLEEMAKNKYLPLLFHDENNRKSYQERILRFFALRNYTEYKTSINKTMNAYMAQYQNADETKIAELKNLFTGTIDIIKQVLGADAFLAVDREKNIVIEKFSGSVYDSIIIPFSFFSAHDLMSHADEIRKAVDELKKDNLQYREDTYAATGSRKRVIGRIMAVYNLLQKITGAYGTIDESRNFSSELKSKIFHPGYICSYCNNEILSIDDAEVDHIVPFSQGGKTDISNAQLLHRHCNREKSDSLEQDFEDDSE
jgi:5-methylcytosine-specific restriction endonuclease McrA